MRDHLAGLLLINNLIILADWWIVSEVLHLTGYWALTAFLIVPLISMSLLPWLSTKYLVQPTRLIWQAILHIAPDTANTPAPDLKENRIGKDLVASLVAHIYQLASVAETVQKTAEDEKSDISADFVASRLPLPLIILDKDDNILFANESLLNYIKLAKDDVIGQNFYSVLDMSFTNEHTFDEWMKNAKSSKAIDSQSWERVKMETRDDKTIRLFDLAAYYNKNNPHNFETMIVLFDHTTQYSQDEQAMSFVALAVHELRTPLTLLRGYIEAFEEELEGKSSPELDDFMHKMSASAQQMATFVNNILNVSRIENDQLSLELREEQWPEIVKSAVGDMSLRAEVRGIKLELQIDPGLPPVGVDHSSIYEVISNLIDNAIKYSGNSKKIIIHSYITKGGMVETTVQDFGVGVPEASIQNLFEKFYRNHRSRSQVGGTGLGLYLSKMIVNAQGGQIWVRSKPGEGSTFGFTVQAYNQVTSKSKDDSDITRTPHGWIKNHSLYRR